MKARVAKLGDRDAHNAILRLDDRRFRRRGARAGVDEVRRHHHDYSHASRGSGHHPAALAPEQPFLAAALDVTERRSRRRGCRGMLHLEPFAKHKQRGGSEDEHKKE